MRIFGANHITYLYVSGIATTKVIKLSNSVELLPARAECSTDLFLGLGKTDVDISVISLFLPQVASQLRIEGSDVEDTARCAWDAIWDAILLGAITSCDVMCNLQSDLPAELLKSDSNIQITNYHLRGHSMQPLHHISNLESEWIEEHFESARELLGEERYRSAIHCLATYRWHSMPRAQLAIIWSGIEGLFNVDSEVVFRISLYAARFLAPDDLSQQKEVFLKVKNLYKLRSKAVHGGVMKGDPQAGVLESANLLRTIISKCAVDGRLPDPEDLFT